MVSAGWEEHKLTALNDLIIDSRDVKKQYLIICDK